MGTIIDYIKEYGDYTFGEKPINEVDSLVLCQFSYLKFDRLVPGMEIEPAEEACALRESGLSEEACALRESGLSEEACALRESGLSEEACAPKESAPTAEACASVESVPSEEACAPMEPKPAAVAGIQELLADEAFDSLFADERYREMNTKLFFAMAHSRRFGTLQIMNYVNQIELERETQFSAITFRLDDGSRYLAYRGTDETIVGWKEDFNLAFSEPVPGQIMSVEYLNRAAAQFAEPFYMGGHSKGGNHAVYAAMNCREEIQERILAIYNHDGPGFRPEVKDACGYDKIESRIRRTIPHSSLVGMLLSSEGSYRVVESRSFGLAQHDPYTWLTEGDDFQIVKDVYSGTLFVDATLNDWILSLNQEQMHIFVDTLYEVITASEADNMIDFTANWKRSIQGILTAVKNVDADTMQVINNIMKALFEMLSQHAKEELISKKKRKS